MRESSLAPSCCQDLKVSQRVLQSKIFCKFARLKDRLQPTTLIWLINVSPEDPATDWLLLFQGSSPNQLQSARCSRPLRLGSRALWLGLQILRCPILCRIVNPEPFERRAVSQKVHWRRSVDSLLQVCPRGEASLCLSQHSVSNTRLHRILKAQCGVR